MEKYTDTITKAKYKNYFKINMNDFLSNIDKNCDTWQDVEEISFDWNLNISQYYKFDDLYNSDNMLNEAINYIIKKTNIERKNLNEHIEEIKNHIMWSCDDAYRNDYINKMFKYTDEAIKNKININIIDEFNIENYQILYYSDEDNTLHDEFKYNTSEIRVYYKYSEINNIRKVLEWKDYSNQEIIVNIEYEINITPINYEYFYRYETIANYDEWLEYFKDYEEISFNILNNRKKQANRIKSLIKNNIPLIYR